MIVLQDDTLLHGMAAMTTDRPRHHDSVESIVDETLARVGRRVVLGTPLGLGKANHLANAFYRRAEADPGIDLTIFTALTLAPPRGSSELERRLVEPLSERLFGGYPELAWVDPLRRGELPANVDVREFYFQPGALLESPRAQRSYVSSNYSHVVRDVLDAGLNVLAQTVSAEEVPLPGGPELRYSLSCNSDLTVDLLPELRARERSGQPVAVLGQVNRRLPFLYGDAMVPPDAFDAVIDRPELEFPLFGPPNLPIGTVEYWIALHVSALVRDGGTLQVGIGSLGDAIVHLLQLRHQDEATYRRLLDDCGVAGRHAELIERWGGTGRFERGLYAASEMLIDGFLELYRAGILKRKVYPDAVLQRLLDAARIGEAVTAATLEALVEEGAVPERLSRRDVARLVELGVLRQGVVLEGDRLVLRGPGAEVEAPADLGEPGARREVADRLLGERLRGGRLAHSCIFLGPRGFYEALAALPREERELFEMTGISYVNELHGEEELKRAQRRHARFVNSGMMATLLGAVVSDGLEDGRVVSGVGGQYNFVAMAHALEDGRSILMIESTREAGGELTSNVVWSYGHATIPRHLRDLVVTEYGIADLRGRSDEEVVAAMLAVADSRFQEGLLEEAKRAGKIAEGYRIPDRFRDNRPERLEETLAPYRERGMFQEFPYGTDLSAEEVVLTKALRGLQKKIEGRDLSVLPNLEEVRKVVTVPEAARPYLERMGLADPQGLQETLLQKAVVFALATGGYV
ncbi:MAG TPA: acetyl-CoA hydrolase/transferase C-terminal domain-containing protein [Thermoanaerobaculia bacterium]|nr:acetyl-CoA hydrolase/transferase C-terminal domain-containing protein [Thermoanaerobaculia bacterium]